MQDTSNKHENPTAGNEVIHLTTQEAATLRKALKATHHLFSVGSNDFAGEWTMVFWKMSLVMTQYFAECPDPAVLHRYVVCMEVLSDFINLVNTLHEPALEAVLAKL